jgi:hypothetical protein
VHAQWSWSPWECRRQEDWFGKKIVNIGWRVRDRRLHADRATHFGFRVGHWPWGRFGF